MFVARRHVAAYRHSLREFADASLRFFTSAGSQSALPFSPPGAPSTVNDIRDGWGAAALALSLAGQKIFTFVTFHLREVHLQVAVSDVEISPLLTSAVSLPVEADGPTLLPAACRDTQTGIFTAEVVESSAASPPCRQRPDPAWNTGVYFLNSHVARRQLCRGSFQQLAVVDKAQIALTSGE